MKTVGKRCVLHFIFLMVYLGLRKDVCSNYKAKYLLIFFTFPLQSYLVLVAGDFNVYNFAVLNMLNEADPTAPESGDPPELAGAEEGVINSMAPLIDTGN